MKLTTVINIAIIFGSIVCGGVFVIFATKGQMLMGLMAGAFIGFASGMMSLGVMSILVRKEDKEIQSQAQQNPTRTPSTLLICIDDKGNQHRLTAEQYGEKCVEWAIREGSLRAIQLRSFGKARNTLDVVAKIHHFPSIAVAHGTAFFVAVHCTYPVLRLGISNESFKGVMQGVKNTILVGGDLFNGHPATTEYLNYLISEVSQYTAILLETSGIAGQSDDRMLFGVGGACQRLISTLDQEYSGVSVSEESEEERKVITTINSPSPNWFDESYINPAVEATRNVDSETLLVSTFGNAATQFVKGTDSSRGLVLMD